MTKSKISVFTKSISHMEFGPYDNGPLILGIDDSLVTLSTSDLTFIQAYQIQESMRNNTLFSCDPPDTVLYLNKDSKELFGLSLIEKKCDYLYIEL